MALWDRIFGKSSTHADGAKAAAKVDIRNEFFQLRLGGDWTVTPSEDKQQYCLTSAKRGCSVTVSYEPIDVAPQRLRAVIEKMTEFRMVAGAKLAAPKRLKLLNINFETTQQGGEKVLYNGRDAEGTYFYHFFGVALPTKIICLYCESFDSSEAENRIAYKEVLDGLTY